MPQAKVPRRVEAASRKALERALKEERLALAAITKVFLLEVPDPARVMARLDAMCRAAEANPRTSAAVRRQLLHATQFVRTAIERETGRPQTLFDPHVGHVAPKDVDKLVAPTEGPSQLGLLEQTTVLGDVEAAHEDRVNTITVIHEAIVSLLRGEGRATDRELHARYLMGDQRWPQQSYNALVERRKELTAAGRVVAAGKLGTAPTWDVVERELMESA